MKEQLEKWKELLKNSGKNRWVVFLLAGLLLLVISIPNGEEQKLPAAQAEVADEKTLDQAETLAAGLERVLSRVHGVGKTKVLVTLKSDGKRLVEKDSSARNSSSKENSGNTDAENTQEENTVYEKNGSGQEIPYVSEVLEPEVAGVLVVAEGGGDPVTVREITEAVQALFGIEVHKIKVMKMD